MQLMLLNGSYYLVTTRLMRSRVAQSFSPGSRHSFTLRRGKWEALTAIEGKTCIKVRCAVGDVSTWTTWVEAGVALQTMT